MAVISNELSEVLARIDSQMVLLIKKLRKMPAVDVTSVKTNLPTRNDDDGWYLRLDRGMIEPGVDNLVVELLDADGKETEVIRLHDLPVARRMGAFKSITTLFEACKEAESSVLADAIDVLADAGLCGTVIRDIVPLNFFAKAAGRRRGRSRSRPSIAAARLVRADQ